MSAAGSKGIDYNKLIETVHPQRVFYFALAPLLGFYALFGAVLYPNAQAIHLSGMRDTLMGLLPVGFHGLVGIVCNWTYSLFFCFAELWGTVVISVLFWTIANDLCSVKEVSALPLAEKHEHRPRRVRVPSSLTKFPSPVPVP